MVEFACLTRHGIRPYDRFLASELPNASLGGAHNHQRYQHEDFGGSVLKHANVPGFATSASAFCALWVDKRHSTMFEPNASASWLPKSACDVLKKCLASFCKNALSKHVNIFFCATAVPPGLASRCSFQAFWWKFRKWGAGNDGGSLTLSCGSCWLALSSIGLVASRLTDNPKMPSARRKVIRLF